MQLEGGDWREEHHCRPKDKKATEAGGINIFVEERISERTVPSTS